MIYQNFFNDALRQPHATYYVSRELAKLYADRAIIEGTHDDFKIEDYARTGECVFVKESDLHSQIATVFENSRKSLTHEITNGWINVLWRGHLIDVVLMTVGYDRYHWIIADTLAAAENFFRQVCEWATEVRGEILVFQEGFWQKDSTLYGAIKNASFDDLVLPVALRCELEADLTQFFAAREMYERFRIPWKRGVLLIGSPGNGKTHAIKALINATKQPCLYVKSFKARHQNDHAAMRSVFSRARAASPCLLVFEDLDSLVTNSNRSFFLNELDGFAANTGVVVLASTNHPERLDASILDRPSRFDRKFYFELPAHAERLAYLNKWNSQLEFEMRLSDEATHELAAATEGFSFAYLKEATLSALMQWMNAQHSETTMDAIMRERTRVLRTQMSEQQAKAAKQKSSTDEEDEEDEEFCEVI